MALNPSSKSFLFDLLSTPSPTGFEVHGQRKWAQRLRKCVDRVESDAYGNAWATLEGATDKGPVIMLEAHADEIGYMVKHVSKDGFIYVERLGGSDVATARGRRVDIFGDQGTVRGVIGNVAVHIRDREDEKVPKVHELWIDIGATSAADVAAAGIRAGHPAVYADGAEEFGNNLLLGRALDNRLGGFIIAEVMDRLSKRKKRLPATVVAVNAVQEEIGGHGAKMVSHRLKPDVAIVLDVTHATDTPGVDATKHGEVKLGGGPSLKHGNANHTEVVRKLIDVAASQKIALQHESLSKTTGTDTDSIYYQQSGIPSALVSLPLRYMHSVVELAHLGDVEQVIELLQSFAESVKEGETFSVKI